jgi:starch synthase
MKKKLKVLFAAAECSPLIKVGGLGDVAGELPIKLKELGQDVSIVIPANKDIGAATKYRGDFPVNMGFRNETCIVREVINAPVPTYIIDNYQYFGRSGVYGHRDDSERFAFFCLAVFEMIRHFEYKPDILHLNDWHTAPLAMLLREKEREIPDLSDIAILYTIHSLEYQGISSRDVFGLFNVRDIVFKLDKVEYYGCFNAMKAGLNYADIINSVSKTFAQQMLTPQFGFGMEGVLQNRKNIIRGVENGINTDNWNPSTDPMIYASYDRDNLAGKLENKKELQKESGLIECDAPLFAVVSRLVPNKGLDLMLDAARDVLDAGGQFILLGSGEKYYENAFLDLLESYPG